MNRSVPLLLMIAALCADVWLPSKVAQRARPISTSNTGVVTESAAHRHGVTHRAACGVDSRQRLFGGFNC